MVRAEILATFVSLRGLLEPYASRPGFTHTASAGTYQLSSSTQADRIGRPLYVAGVQVNRAYVSYHLMPIYMNQALQIAVPAVLRKRMQGKSCFNFTSIDPDLLHALSALTDRAIGSFKDVTLPWDTQQQPKKRSGGRMALGKGKKKNTTGTRPKTRTASPAQKAGGEGPRKVARGKTTRSGDK
jgi:hypothetical protein